MALTRFALWESHNDVLINTDKINLVAAQTAESGKYPGKTMLQLTVFISDGGNNPVNIHAIDDQGDPDLRTFNDASEAVRLDAARDALRSFQGRLAHR